MQIDLLSIRPILASVSWTLNDATSQSGGGNKYKVYDLDPAMVDMFVTNSTESLRIISESVDLGWIQVGGISEQCVHGPKRYTSNHE